MRKSVCSVFAGLMMACLSVVAIADDSSVIGSVSTTFKVFGPNDKIVLSVFDDPDVKGVSCYLSSAKTGGMSGAVGLATDASDAAVSCMQTGPISFDDSLQSGKEAFSERRSLVFKELHVVRFIDKERKMLIYMTYSDLLIDGSPKNSISAVSYGVKQ
jgi:CreA protein